MTIGPKARTPVSGSPRLQIVRASGEALTAGVDRHDTEGVSVGPANRNGMVRPASRRHH